MQMEIQCWYSMVNEYKFNQMVLNTKETGMKDSSKAMVDSCTLIKICMKENSKQEWQVVRVFIPKCQVKSMMVIG